MPRVDPGLMPVVVDLERGLRELGVPFGIVGALVPELLLDVRPYRMTNDVDLAVVVESLADFDLLEERLADYGFTRTRRPHRLDHRDGGWVDILPVNETIARDGLELEDGFVLNMAGFGHVVPNAVPIAIEGGPTLPLAPLPLHVLLKLVAFSDRKAPKDLAGVLHCLEHYLEDDGRRYGVDHDDEGVPYEYTGAYVVGVEDDGRRYGVDHDDEGVPYEYTGAYVVGVEARPFLDDRVSEVVKPVLDRFDEPDATVVGVVAREAHGLIVEDEHRLEIFELFRWYRLGTGL